MANFFNQLVLGWLWCVVTQFEMTYHVEDVGDLAVVVDAVGQNSSQGVSHLFDGHVPVEEDMEGESPTESLGTNLRL